MIKITRGKGDSDDGLPDNEDDDDLFMGLEMKSHMDLGKLMMSENPPSIINDSKMSENSKESFNDIS